MSGDAAGEGRSRAVALQWDGQSAPRVTASGSGATAAEILRIAEANQIPLQQDPVLVQALSQIPIGDEIPRQLYVAVAEILAFVFMLEGIDATADPRACAVSRDSRRRPLAADPGQITRHTEEPIHEPIEADRSATPAAARSTPSEQPPID